VLVLRGNDEVIQSTVNNPGAEFSERGFTRLVNRAEGDDNLATCLGMRPTIPRHLYLKLIAKASVTVRERLEAANPQLAGEVPTAVREATWLARSAPSAITRETAIAHALVKSLYEDGRLDEFQVAAFAEAGKFDEANAAIAALANVAVSTAENMMVETRAEGVMILAKVSGMSWSTVKALINMRDDLSGMGPSDLAACKATYERLRPSTAQQVLRFHRMQQTAPSAA
jgi:type II secretory pathway component PulM